METQASLRGVRLSAQNATATAGTSAEALQYVKDKAKGPGLPHVTIIAANRLVRLPETSDVKELLTAAESAMSGVASVVIAVCEPVAWL